MNTSESPSSGVESGRTDLAEHCPTDAEPIDFRHERTRRPDLWMAALEATVTIRAGGRPDLFVVEGDELPANCSLVDTGSTHRGWCSCDTFHDLGVCLHLCAIRQAAVVDRVSIPRLASSR